MDKDALIFSVTEMVINGQRYAVKLDIPIKMPMQKEPPVPKGNYQRLVEYMVAKYGRGGLPAAHEHWISDALTGASADRTSGEAMAEPLSPSYPTARIGSVHSDRLTMSTRAGRYVQPARKTCLYNQDNV